MVVSLLCLLYPIDFSSVWLDLDGILSIGVCPRTLLSTLTLKLEMLPFMVIFRSFLNTFYLV